MSSSSSTKKLQPWQSLTAGLVAGAVEGFITYPAEMTKTACQFSAKQGAPVSPLAVVKTTFQQRGIRGFYSGCSALVVGNSAKAGVRFFCYDGIKDLLKDQHTGKLSTGGSILAGAAAGACEAVIAVTPSEAIKTKLIDDARRATPRFHGSAHGLSMIVREEGVTGLYRGLTATILKQSANSAVRFTSYNALVSGMRALSGQQSGPLPSVQVFACGAGAGIITVYATMPFDVVKTRMQGLEAAAYANSFDCARKVIQQDGVAALWGGSTARLSRLMFSGAIVFTVYEKMAVLLKQW